MGAALSGFFQNNCGHFLASGVRDSTRQTILALLDELPRMQPGATNWTAIETHLTLIPKGENILCVTGSDGYNLLQWAVGLRCVELVRWLVAYGVDVNRGPCSLPLHISALNGCTEIGELLYRYGARTEQEARMCYPGLHSNNCELRAPTSSSVPNLPPAQPSPSPDRCQNAICYAIDGDKADFLEFLIDRTDDNWLPWTPKRPLLYLAFERRAWSCVKVLLPHRHDEVNQCYDEDFPIHQAVKHENKFLELLLQCNADVTVRTATQQLTVLHVLLLLGKKSANDTMDTLKLLFDHGAKELINEPDSLGNTPLHALIVRYALEEFRYGGGYNDNEHCTPWTTWDMLHLTRYLLQHKAAPSINAKGNSALACVLRHVRDWEFRFELLNMLLQHGGDPNCVGRDGSVPLIVCLVPLLNKGLLHLLNHAKKVSYLSCVRILCKFGADPNCSWRTNLTPLHVLVFTASEYITMANTEEKGAAFEFIQQVMTILLQHKLNPNVLFSQRTQHVLLALLDMVQNARCPADLDYVYELTRTLLTYGADADTLITNDEPTTFCTSQSSLYIKKPINYVLYYYVKYLVKKEDTLIAGHNNYEKLLRLYYNAMGHEALYACTKELVKQVTVGSMRTGSTQLVSTLRSMSTTPRSLKCMTRKCIYDALGGRLAPNISRLQLPTQLREYLLEFK